MFCPYCGAQNADNIQSCCACRRPLQGQLQPQQFASSADIPNYLVWSILTTLFCCLPLGIVAIIYSADVNTKLATGDFNGAMEASSKAKFYIGLSIAGYALLLCFAFFIVIIYAQN